MANKKKKQISEPAERSAAEYYNLKTDAVERLVNAENAPEVSEAEINRYRSKKKTNTFRVCKMRIAMHIATGIRHRPYAMKIPV